MKKITYKGWKNCVLLANKQVELVVITEVGPRIIRFGFKGGDNEFMEFKPQLGKKGGQKWLIYGGHRLWHAPESMPRTYFPDNVPVKVEERKGLVRFIQTVETTTGIQKEMDISLSSSQARVKVAHRLRNTGPWAVELAPWALSVMAPGGKVIIPLPPRGPHSDPKNLPPTSTLTLWSYTDLSDARWVWGSKYFMLQQNPSQPWPQKIGAMVPDGWAAYANRGRLFLKRFAFQPGKAYPDHGCSVETFTNGQMLEVESCGPLTSLRPGASVEHVEEWSLYRNVPEPHNDADVERLVLPLVRASQKKS